MSVFFDCVLDDIQVATFVFLAPRFAFFGSCLIVIFYLALATGVDYLMLLTCCFCHTFNFD